MIKELIGVWRKNKSDGSLLAKMKAIFYAMKYEDISAHVASLENNEKELRKLAIQLMRIYDRNKNISKLKNYGPFTMSIGNGVLLKGHYVAMGFHDVNGGEFDLSASNVRTPSGSRIDSIKILQICKLFNDKGEELWSSEIYEKLMQDLENKKSEAATAQAQTEAKVVTPNTAETVTLSSQDIAAELRGVTEPKKVLEKLQARVKEGLDKSTKGVNMKLTVAELKPVFEASIRPMLESVLKAQGVDKLDISGLTIKSLSDGTYAIGGIKIEGIFKGFFPWKNTISISLQPQKDGIPQIIKLNHSDPIVGNKIDGDIANAGGIAKLNENLQTPKILGLLAQAGISATGVGATVSASGELELKLNK